MLELDLIMLYNNGKQQSIVIVLQITVIHCRYPHSKRQAQKSFGGKIIQLDQSPGFLTSDDFVRSN